MIKIKAIIRDWFTSFFGWATTILLIHALIAQFLGSDKIWKIAAWSLLAAHAISYILMCVFILILVGPSISLLANHIKK